MPGVGDTQQCLASHWPSGYLTGKTTWVVRNVLAAIEKYGQNNIMVASLTRAAAFEFQSRGLHVVPDGQIGTLHHICLAALDHPTLFEKYRADWNIYVDDQGSPSFELSPQSSQDEPPAEKTDGDNLFNELSLLRNREPFILDQGPEKVLHRSLLRFHELWEAWKDNCDYVDFTDLIEYCLRDIETAPGNPKVMFGDEAQDWSKLEIQLFRDHWGIHPVKLILVGDPDQAIFEWRGANPRIFLDHPVSPEQKILLSQSYRVPRAVRDCALSWIKSEVHDRDDVIYEPRPERGCVVLTDAGFKTPSRLQTLFEEIYASGDTCMILASCHYMLQPTLAALKRWHLPYGNPYRPDFNAWNPLRFGTSKSFRKKASVTKLDRILAFLANDTELFGDGCRTWTWKDIQMWCEPLRAKNDPVLSSRAKAELRFLVKESTLAGPYTMTSFGELFQDSWDGPHAEPAHKVNLDWWVRSMLEPQRKGFTYLAGIVATRGPRTLVEPPRIWPSTIHAVKGGQADTVILFPDISPAASEQQWGSVAGRCETARLFYVAMTRAYKRLVICSPESVHHVPLHKYSTPVENAVPF